MATKKKITKIKNKKESVKVIVPEDLPIEIDDSDGRGRPLKFADKRELEEKIDGYFKACEPHLENKDIVVGYVRTVDQKIVGKNTDGTDKVIEKVQMKPAGKFDIANHYEVMNVPTFVPQRPLTITGLAVHLGTTRELLNNYSKTDYFHDTIKKARSIIHNYSEESLWTPMITSGVIFNLKNNWGWKDQTETLTKQAPTGKEHLSDEALDLEIELKNRANGNKGK